MFNFFYLFSQTRKLWLLLISSACVLEIIALYFQHSIGIKPCVLCIYERITIFAILISGLIAIIKPESILRYIALTIWLFSSWYGIRLTWKHIKFKFNSSPFELCDLVVNMPTWLPLNNYFPAIFEAYSDCMQKQWSFLKIEMPIWLLIVFITYFLLAITILISQFLYVKVK